VGDYLLQTFGMNRRTKIAWKLNGLAGLSTGLMKPNVPIRFFDPAAQKSAPLSRGAFAL